MSWTVYPPNYRFMQVMLCGIVAFCSAQALAEPSLYAKSTGKVARLYKSAAKITIFLLEDEKAGEIFMVSILLGVS